MFRKSSYIIAASLLFVTLPALADVPRYDVIPEKSKLKFYAIQNGAALEGKFSDFTADIAFDPDQLDKSNIRVEVATGSILTANDDVNKNIKTSEWLSVEVFPKAVFKSNKILRMPNSNNYYAEGDLTLRDQTMPVVVNFIMEHFDDKNAIAKGYVTLRRTDFGVGQGEWARDDVIKNEVRVEFRIAAKKQ